MPQDIKSILDKVQAEKSAKADAWDVFHTSEDPDNFKLKMDKVGIPKEAKAALWDAKFGKNKQLSSLNSDPMDEMLKSEFIQGKPKEEARRLLTARSKKFAGMSPDEQDKTLSGIGPKEVKDGPAGKVAEGAGRLFKGMAFDFPKSVYHDIKDKPTEEEIGRHRRHPNVFAEPERGVGLTVNRLILDPQIEEYKKANKAGAENKTSEMLGHAGAAAVPGFGPVAAHFGEEIGKGQFWEAMGEAGAMYLTSLFGSKITKEAGPAKRMAKAAGGNYRDFEVVSGDLAKSAAKYGRPKTLGELEDLVKATGKDLESEFNIHLQPLAGQARMPGEVSQALLNEANSSHLLKTPEGRAARAYLRHKAVDYMRPWTLGELNKQRMDMFNARYANKSQVGKMSAVRSDIELKADQIIEDKLRDIVYGDMDAHYGSAMNFRKLKEKQSRILSIMDRMEKQVDSLSQAQAEFDAAGPAEKLGLSLSAHGGGATPRVHGLMKSLQGGPEVTANKHVRRAFPASLKDIGSKTGAKDVLAQGGKTATRNAIRALPLATVLEKSKAKPKKKPLTSLK